MCPRHFFIFKILCSRRAARHLPCSTSADVKAKKHACRRQTTTLQRCWATLWGRKASHTAMVCKWEPFPRLLGAGWALHLPLYTISHSAAMIPQVCSHVQAGRPYRSGYGAQWGSHHSEKCSGSICSPPPGHWLTREPLTAHISTPVAWFIIFPVHMASCPSSGLLGVD